MRNSVPAILRLTVNNAVVAEQPINIPPNLPELTDEQNIEYRKGFVEFEAYLLRRQHLQKLIKLNDNGIVYLVIENQLNDYDFENEA